MACFQQASFAYALPFTGKGRGADTLLQDTHKPHKPLMKVVGLSEVDLSGQLPVEKMSHSFLSSKHNLMTVSNKSQL